MEALVHDFWAFAAAVDARASGSAASSAKSAKHLLLMFPPRVMGLGEGLRAVADS